MVSRNHRISAKFLSSPYKKVSRKHFMSQQRCTLVVNQHPLRRSGLRFGDRVDHDFARQIFNDEALFSSLLHNLLPCILLANHSKIRTAGAASNFRRACPRSEQHLQSPVRCQPENMGGCRQSRRMTALSTFIDPK